MSIKQEIINHVNDGSLELVTPKVLSDKSLRKLYLTRELYDTVYEDKESLIEQEIFSNLIADLEVFVTSSTIDPYYLWCLEPRKEGIWEIRSTRPKYQIRIFGAFAAKDIFIATHYKPRDDLGSKHSGQWKPEIKRTQRTWNDLFPAYTHKKTNDPNQLFTGALNEKYFK